MTDDFRKMFDATIVQQNERDQRAEAKRAQAELDAQTAREAADDARTAALAKFITVLKIVDEAVVAINERTAETGVTCAQEDFEERDCVIRRILFRRGERKAPSLQFELTPKNQIAVTMSGAPRAEMSLNTFERKNVMATANTHFLRVLSDVPRE